MRTGLIFRDVTISDVRLLEEHRSNVRACSRCFSSGGNAPVVDRCQEQQNSTRGSGPGGNGGYTTWLPFTGPAWIALRAGSRGLAFREGGCTSQLCAGASQARRRVADLVPSRVMIRNCRPHLSRGFELLQPEIVVPVGGLAIKELLRIAPPSEALGGTFKHDWVVHVPLPHPSKASTWLNKKENKERLNKAFAMLKKKVSVLRTREGTSKEGER